MRANPTQDDHMYLFGRRLVWRRSGPVSIGSVNRANRPRPGLSKFAGDSRLRRPPHNDLTGWRSHNLPTSAQYHATSILPAERSENSLVHQFQVWGKGLVAPCWFQPQKDDA